MMAELDDDKESVFVGNMSFKSQLNNKELCQDICLTIINEKMGNYVKLLRVCSLPF